MGLAATRQCSSSSSTAAPSVAVFASSHFCCRSHHASAPSSPSSHPSSSSVFGLLSRLGPSAAHKASPAAAPSGDVMNSSGTRHAVKRRSVEHDHLWVLNAAGSATTAGLCCRTRGSHLALGVFVASPKCVAKRQESQPQEARLASCGTRQDGHPRRALFGRAGARDAAAGPVHAAHCAAMPAAQGRRRRARRR